MTKDLMSLEKKAEQGDIDAQCELGYAYLSGEGIPQDYTKAAKWYGKAAEKGDTDAMLGLGNIYSHGLGVSQDYTKASEWFSKAAEKGDADAQFYLGLAYSLGQGVPKDFEKAQELVHKAAEGGSKNAKNFLAEMDAEKSKNTKNYSTGDPEKRKFILIIIFSAIGLLIGLLIGGNATAYNFNDKIFNLFIGLWLGLGIGGNLVSLPFFLGIALRTCKEEWAKGEPFWKTLGLQFLGTIVLFLLKSLTGPIFPIIKIVKYVRYGDMG